MIIVVYYTYIEQEGKLLKFEQLSFFKEAVKYHSISVAAEKNFMSQSSISHAIISLEKELGAELLKRTSAGVTPTSIGELVLQKTEDILKSVDEITEMTKEQKNIGEVHLSCIPCICNWIIPLTLQHTKQSRAEISLSVTTAESIQVAHLVSSGLATFGILINHEELIRNKDLQYTPLFEDEYVLYIGKSSPYWQRESITYDEMLKEPYIAYGDEFRTYNGGLTNIIGRNELPKIAFRTNNLDAIKSMISHHQYVAFFPQYMSDHDFYIQSGWIRPLRISDKQLRFNVGYVESLKYKAKKIDHIVLNALKEAVKKGWVCHAQSK